MSSHFQFVSICDPWVTHLTLISSLSSCFAFLIPLKWIMNFPRYVCFFKCQFSVTSSLHESVICFITSFFRIQLYLAYVFSVDLNSWLNSLFFILWMAFPIFAISSFWWFFLLIILSKLTLSLPLYCKFTSESLFKQHSRNETT